QGRSIFGPYATLRVRKTPGEASKAAFITSTKVFKLSVDRNLAKRRMREAVATLWNQIPPETQVLFVLKPESKTAEYPKLLAEVTRLLSKIPEALLQPPKPSSRARKNSEKMSRPKKTT
ncbi:MAG: ribonuclease P protein component, partial [Alphaproteobacteria bacterium]|nr:ribonuclease P protein component [Alphaproteobacteria bacterium]